MTYCNWGPELTPGTAIGTMLALLGVVCLVAWQVKRVRARGNSWAQGTLLLQMEVNGMLLAHIAMLTAEERTGKPKYRWCISELHPDDFPHMQMTDLLFTHIIVNQKRAKRNLVTISVLDQAKRFWAADFYWVRNATIGEQPGFPRELLLPCNLVLKYLS